MAFQQQQQQEFIRKMADVSKDLIKVKDDIDFAVNFFWGNGFNSGGGNEITDTTFDGSNYQGITAQMIADVITVFQSIQTDLDQAHIQNLMKIIK